MWIETDIPGVYYRLDSVLERSAQIVAGYGGPHWGWIAVFLVVGLLVTLVSLSFGYSFGSSPETPSSRTGPEGLSADTPSDLRPIGTFGGVLIATSPDVGVEGGRPGPRLSCTVHAGQTPVECWITQGSVVVERECDFRREGERSKI